MAQRKAKRSRRQAVSRRRWHDLHDAKQHKYTGPWKRRDRRRAAFQTMKTRFRIAQHYHRLWDSGVKKGLAAWVTAKTFACSPSPVRNLASSSQDSS